MGTISEEMKKVMEKWNASAIPAPATETQTQIETETQPKGQTMQQAHFPSYRAQIHDFINKHPKATTATVLDYMQKHHPAMGHSSISSQLTTMFQDCTLTREQVFDKNAQRNVYAYTAVSLDVAEKLRKERDRKLAQAQARMERARQAKAEKAKAKAKQIVLIPHPKASPQIPLPFDAPVVAETVSTPVATAVATIAPVSLSGMTAMQILQGINFAQAKELYKELKEAFGG